MYVCMYVRAYVRTYVRTCVILYNLAGRFIMEKIDLVVVGAEGVVESGGIINKVSALHSGHCINMGIALPQIYRIFNIHLSLLGH